ncbi:hypothetical protein PLICRDRAFT_39679 [Plicaturopsis crispa FD-325 SS-3]|nr:hypothetical protein PLICRDRAFT_39679 [Plicaturopsis crispa FD-325 SS-3]
MKDIVWVLQGQLLFRRSPCCKLEVVRMNRQSLWALRPFVFLFVYPVLPGLGTLHFCNCTVQCEVYALAMSEHPIGKICSNGYQ